MSEANLQAERAGFEAHDVENLRPHYARTLRLWSERLEARRDEAVRVGGAALFRLFRVYFAVAAARFESGQHTVNRSLLGKPDRGKARSRRRGPTSTPDCVSLASASRVRSPTLNARRVRVPRMKQIRAAVLAAVAIAGPAQAQVTWGPVVRVGALPLDDPGWANASVATTTDGALVVLWFDGGERVAGRRLDAWGHRVGGEFDVPSSTTSIRAAAAANGGFVAGWGDQSGVVRVRCFDRDGRPLLAAVPGLGGIPDVSSDGGGNFVVAWSNLSATQVVAQRHSGSCIPVGAVVPVSPVYATGTILRVSVASASDGRFVVVWNARDGNGQDAIFARPYAADGTPATAVLQVNTSAANVVHAVDMADDGGYVVAWVGEVNQGLLARRFDSAGTPLGVPFTVAPSGYAPDVVHTSSGGFVVGWVALDAQGGQVALRHYTAGGAAGPILTAGPAHWPPQRYAPSFAPQRHEVVALAWVRPDGPQHEVALRRFGPVMARAAGADGNGVLEPGEDVEVIPTWANGTGAPATMTGVATAFDGPAGPGVTYSLLDAAASYGTLPDGAAGSCTLTGDCHRAGVSAPALRPAAHWDAALDEVISFGAATVTHRWPVHVGESFTDVPAAGGFYRFAETLLHAGVTAGCGASVYCPASSVTREQMAVFVLRSRHDGYLSWPCAGASRRFDDVPATSAFCRWIEDLARRNVVTGCDATNYCPTAPVSRQEMSIFVLATREASGYTPPACGVPLFADVPANSPFCPWIEELARRGVVTGCGGGSYCPTAPVSREQMGVFLAATFGLSLSVP